MDKYIYNTCTLSENITIMCSKRLKLSLWKNKFDFYQQCTLYLNGISSCVKKFTTTAKLYWKEQKQETRFQAFSRVSSVAATIYCYHFLLFALEESGTRRLLFVYQTIKAIIYFIPLLYSKWNDGKIKITLQELWEPLFNIIEIHK